MQKHPFHLVNPSPWPIFASIALLLNKLFYNPKYLIYLEYFNCSSLGTKTTKSITPSISPHAPKALKPKTKEEFAYFMAGLIDADGHIAKTQITITFHIRDIASAYYFKKIVGSGSVRPRKKEKACDYRCSSVVGRVLITDLIRNKIRTPSKIDQFNSHVINNAAIAPTFLDHSAVSLTNHWLAGFIQGDGSFQIQIQDHGTKPIRIVVEISQKTDYILKQIKDTFGGYIGYRKSQDTYSYTSSSFPRAAAFINYLDQYQVMSTNLTLYQLWRQAYLCIQKKAHLTERGREAVKKLKAAMTTIRA